jgi:hypothetical protein
MTRVPARVRALLVALVVVVVGSACEMNVQVGIDVREDGSGTVTVGVGLDDDAVAKLGGADNLRSIVKVDDLQHAGWTITGPQEEHDGLTWLRASKAFLNPQQATVVLGEVASGPFAGFRLVRSRSYARTRFTFDGVADLTRGIEAFSDPELTTLLDGKPLGQDVAAIEQQFGGKIDDLVHVTVAVRLPGAVTSNASAVAANGAVWRPALSDTEPTVLHATSQSWHTTTLLFSALAAASGVALVAVVVVHVARRGRRSVS